MIPTLVCTPPCLRNPAHAVAVTTARRGRLRRERFAFEELMCPRPARGSGRKAACPRIAAPQSGVERGPADQRLPPPRAGAGAERKGADGAAPTARQRAGPPWPMMRRPHQVRTSLGIVIALSLSVAAKNVVHCMRRQ